MWLSPYLPRLNFHFLLRNFRKNSPSAAAPLCCACRGHPDGMGGTGGISPYPSIADVPTPPSSVDPYLGGTAWSIAFPKYWEHSELKKQTKGEPQRSRKLMASHDIRRKVRSWHRTLLCKPNKLHKLHQSWRPNAGSKLKPFKCFAKSLYTSTTRGLAKGFPEVLWSMWSMNIHDILRR